MIHARIVGQLPFAYAVMVLTPLLFSTNIIFGRVTVHEVAPFTLAFLRWGFCAVILAPFVIGSAGKVRVILRDRLPLIVILGFLGMWMAGAVVYLSLQVTTATNGALIYTTSPLWIILLERIFAGRSIRRREIAGIILAFIGVAAIVIQGRLTTFAINMLNLGDVGFLLAALSWAGYSILFRDPQITQLPILSLFGLACTAGAVLLFPFAAWEFLSGARMPVTETAWLGIAGIVVFSSLFSFSGFQFGIRRLGPSISGIFIYLVPVYGVVLAVVFLGESFQLHHLIGTLLVLGGVIIATVPLGRSNKKPLASTDLG